MANEIITTLHPDGDSNTNLYPNIKKDNIPSNSIDRLKLDESINELLNNIDELHPSGVDTSTNILAFTTNKGIYIGSDTGYWYYWNGTQYASGGVYQASVDVEKLQCRKISMLNSNSFTKNHYDVSGSIGTVSDPSNPLYNKWACADELLCVGNTRKIIIQTNYPVQVDVIVYKYNSSRQGIDFDQVYKLNKYQPLEINKPSGTEYVRISLNDTTGLDITNYDFVVYLLEWSFYINGTYSNANITPVSDFGVNVIVEQTGRGDYTDISDAYNDNDRKPCMEIKNGIYEMASTGLSLGKAFIKGENMDLTIFKNSNAHYPYGAFECEEGVIDNITFYSTADNTSTPAFAMHLDNNSIAGKKIKFNNCVFISDYNAAIGIGLRRNTDLTFINCTFISNNVNSVAGSAKGAVFFHDSIDSDYYGYQSINFINCIFKSANAYALSIESVNSANTLIATFINCNLYTKERQNKNVIYFTNGRSTGFLCGNSIKLSNQSNGNNIELLNYKEQG